MDFDRMIEAIQMQIDMMGSDYVVRRLPPYPDENPYDVVAEAFVHLAEVVWNVCEEYATAE